MQRVGDIVKRQIMARKKGKKQVLIDNPEVRKAREMQYRRELQAITKAVSVEIDKFLASHADLLQSSPIQAADAQVQDAYQYPPANIMAALSAGLKSIFGLFTGAPAKQKAEKTAKTMVEGVDRDNADQMTEELKKASGTAKKPALPVDPLGHLTQIDLARIIRNEDLEAVLSIKTAENVALIKTIPANMLAQVESAVLRNMTGQLPGGLNAEIARINGGAMKRAKLIARDQTQKTNAAITQVRNQNLGITEYVWLAHHDDRTRPSHRANDGKTFSWDKPPKETGHPGRDINCRCGSKAILNFDQWG